MEELDQRVWLFEASDSDESILILGKDSDNVPIVSAASIYKIIQRITFDQYPGITTFLVFMNPLNFTSDAYVQIQISLPRFC